MGNIIREKAEKVVEGIDEIRSIIDELYKKRNKTAKEEGVSCQKQAT